MVLPYWSLCMYINLSVLRAARWKKANKIDALPQMAETVTSCYWHINWSKQELTTASRYPIYLDFHGRNFTMAATFFTKYISLLDFLCVKMTVQDSWPCSWLLILQNVFPAMGSSFENQIEQEQASRREEIINMPIALNQLLYSMQRRLHNDYDSDSFEFKCWFLRLWLAFKASKFKNFGLLAKTITFDCIFFTMKYITRGYE